tara:strand:- start:501 stop:2321 length:1821 start_codon:yes stop_codon:yes gene_type:complete
MKNKLKKSFRLGFTLFAIGLLMTNCEKDNLHEDALEIENQESTFTLKQYSRENIEKNTKLVSRLKEFNDNLIEKKSAKTSEKKVYNEEYDFTIYTESATYIENGDYHSYTFPIVQGTDDKITNILFELNDENEYDAYLVNYDYSANELKNQDFSSLSMKTFIKPIDLDFNSLYAKTMSAYICVYSYEYVRTGTHFSDGPSNLIVEEYSWVLTASHCETVLYYEQDYIDYHNNNNTAPVTIGGTTYGGTGGSTTSPMPSPFNSEELMKINVVKSELNLNHSERIWIDKYENAQYAFKIYDYLIGEMFSEDAINFGKLAVEALMEEEVDSFEEFIAESLNDELAITPDLLIEIDCNQLVHWLALAQHTAPSSVIDKINGLPSGTFNDFEIQSLSDANGTMVNLDYFPVKITTLPNNPNTGLQFTADEFLDYFRRNINDFTTGSTFEPYCENSSICTQETTLWDSSDPTGALIYIDIPFDDGVVICSEYSNDYWYFMTMNAPYAGNHPVSGARQFGYELNPDGSYNFFVRGVDRFDSNIAENVAYMLSGGDAFLGADALWESFQEKLNIFVNDNGGNSTELSPVINRPDWDKVQDVLLGLRPISDLGCN